LRLASLRERRLTRVLTWALMDFSDEYVVRGSPQDRFPDGEAQILPCRFCGRPLLLRPGAEPDCGVHLN
jgi:hypothetical protein